MSYLFGKFGMSNLGNTSGTSGTVNRGIVFAGGNNVTLSQSVNASSATLTISAAAQTVQTQNLHNVTLSGNTAGVMAQVSSGTLMLAGGNNVTLSQNGNAVTVSAANQTVQTQNLHNVTLSGNTAGAMAHISSGTLTLAGGNNITLSQNGNAVSIIGGAGGGGGGIALANSQTTYTSGTANLSVVGGAMTIASTTGQSFNFSVPQTSSLAATGIVSISSNGSTITIGADPSMTGLYFDNMIQQNSIQAITFSSVSTQMTGRLLLQPLSPGNELFPFRISASTMRLGFSNSGSSNISGAHSSSWYVGIYTRVNSTQLSLLNSVSTSYGLAANAGNSASYLGHRWLSFHSSQWSSAPTFEQGSRYFFGVLARTAGATYASISLAGMHLGHSQQRSGDMAAAASSNTSYNAWHPFMGVHTNTTMTGVPVSIANSEINKAVSYANFIPQVIFDAGLGQMG